jgi:hypothetical protein
MVILELLRAQVAKRSAFSKRSGVFTISQTTPRVELRRRISCQESTDRTLARKHRPNAG